MAPQSLLLPVLWRAFQLLVITPNSLVTTITFHLGYLPDSFNRLVRNIPTKTNQWGAYTQGALPHPLPMLPTVLPSKRPHSCHIHLKFFRAGLIDLPQPWVTWASPWSPPLTVVSYKNNPVSRTNIWGVPHAHLARVGIVKPAPTWWNWIKACYQPISWMQSPAIQASGMPPGRHSCSHGCFCIRQPWVEETKGTPTQLTGGASWSTLPGRT